MIFWGSDAIYSKRQHKVRYREACVTETAVPSFLCWSESPITFDQRDHPSHITRLGRYPLVVDAIVRKKRLTKVLMDGGSGLNILYIHPRCHAHPPVEALPGGLPLPRGNPESTGVPARVDRPARHVWRPSQLLLIGPHL